MRGGMSASERRRCEAALAVPASEERLILATGRYIGEGFDDPRLDTLFLTMPISWKGTLAQYVGRLHRQHVGKTNVLVVDYVDGAVPVLARMAARRRAGYRSLGSRQGRTVACSASSKARNLCLRRWVWMSVSKRSCHSAVVPVSVWARAASASQRTARS